MIFWIIIWFIVLAALVAIEVVTADLLTIWFMPAAVVCIVLAALKVSFPIQIIVFFVLSAIFVVLYKKVLKKYIVSKKNQKTNVDLIVEETGVVQEEINNLAATGLVKVKAQMWTARSSDDSVVLHVGEHVRVVSVEGVKLICEKVDA